MKPKRAPRNTKPKCQHPPTRLYAWHARDYKTGKNSVLCIGCSECGAVLQGGAK